jgi:hypothetical protein
MVWLGRTTIWLTCGLLVLGTGLPAARADDDPPPGVFRPHGNTTTVDTTVTTQASGVDTRISVRQQAGGDARPATGPGAGMPQPASVSAPSGGGSGRTTSAAAGPGRGRPEGGAGQPSSAGEWTIYVGGRDDWASPGRAAAPSFRPADPAAAGTPAAGPLATGPRPQGTRGGAPAAVLDPREVAFDVLDHLPTPNVTIRMNPALGLVAMPSWFWVEGYDGQPFGASRTVNVPAEVGPEVPTDSVPADSPRRQSRPYTVTVRVSPSSYQWSFGDGASLVSKSLGKPYPAVSDIQHTYEYSSLRFPSGFPLQLTIEFAAEFRVNGGAPQALPPIRRTYSSSHLVQEVQPVLTGGEGKRQD